MKTQVKILCALAFAASLATVSAAEKNKQTAKAPVKPVKVEKKVVKPKTGTYVGRAMRVQGQITDGPYNLVIVDSEAIRRSGASTVSQLLSVTGNRR